MTANDKTKYKVVTILKLGFRFSESMVNETTLHPVVTFPVVTSSTLTEMWTRSDKTNETLMRSDL